MESGVVVRSPCVRLLQRGIWRGVRVCTNIIYMLVFQTLTSDAAAANAMAAAADGGPFAVRLVESPTTANLSQIRLNFAGGVIQNDDEDQTPCIVPSPTDTHSVHHNCIATTCRQPHAHAASTRFTQYAHKCHAPSDLPPADSGRPQR